MKLHDSVERILKQKGSEVYSIRPDVTVYEALEKLAEKNIGALVVMDGDQSRRASFRTRLRAQGDPQGAFLEGNESRGDHVEPGRHRGPEVPQSTSACTA